MRFYRLSILFGFLVAAGSAQWLNFLPPGTPTRAGKVDLAARTPRTANGKPDLSGVWHVQTASLAEMKRLYGDDIDATTLPGMEPDTISKYAINILVDFKPAESPMRPDAGGILAKNVPGTNPADRCMPIGIPAAGLVSEFTRIIQSPGTVAILYESDGTHRTIFADGRRFPKEFVQPAWLGYSIGKWEGDTLVVETAGFNDKTWLDLMGHPHSEKLHVVERYHRRDFGHMDVEMTFDDPKMYTRPFTVKVTHELQADSDLLETLCNENEKDRAHEVRQ